MTEQLIRRLEQMAREIEEMYALDNPKVEALLDEAAMNVRDAAAALAKL